MVLTDDNFATVVAAVEEGRTIFANIIKSIQFLLSCNVGGIRCSLSRPCSTGLLRCCPSISCGSTWSPTASLPWPWGLIPLKPALWIENRGIGKAGSSAGAWCGVSLPGIMVGLDPGRFLATRQPDHRPDYGLRGAGPLQLVHLQRPIQPALHLRTGILSNPQLLGAIFISAVMQISVISVPLLAGIFDVVMLTAGQWLVVLLLSLAPLLIVEMVKLLGLNTAADED